VYCCLSEVIENGLTHEFEKYSLDLLFGIAIRELFNQPSTKVIRNMWKTPFDSASRVLGAGDPVTFSITWSFRVFFRQVLHVAMIAAVDGASVGHMFLLGKRNFH